MVTHLSHYSVVVRHLRCSVLRHRCNGVYGVREYRFPDILQYQALVIYWHITKGIQHVVCITGDIIAHTTLQQCNLTHRI